MAEENKRKPKAKLPPKEIDARDRFILVKTPQGASTRMLLPQQDDDVWPYTPQMLDKIAKDGDDGSVLITGETGTGKELLAYYLHNNSRRHQGPFVAVNCAGFTEQLMRAELFGHEPGSFTGATSKSLGRVREAEGGTLFLDEITAMDSANQARLLRFMQTREIEPVGGKICKSNVRVIAATNKPVQPGQKDAALIPDLFHRFRFNKLTLPALRDRQADIFRLLLQPDFLGTEDVFTGITTPTLVMLAAQEWPGNIRELKRYCDEVRLFGSSDRASVWALPRNQDRTGVVLKHIYHDRKLVGSYSSLYADLEFCLRIAAAYYCFPYPWSEQFWNTLQLVCSFRPRTSDRLPSFTCSFGPHQKFGKRDSLTVVVAHDEHVVPFSALRDDLEREEYSPWGLFDFDPLSVVLGDRMRLPASWHTQQCGLAEALANLGCYCRRYARDKKGVEAELEGVLSARDINVQKWRTLEEDDKDIYKHLHLNVPAPVTYKRVSVRELIVEIEKHREGLPILPIPKPPSPPGPAFEKLLAAVDLGRCRRHDPDTVKEVLRLYHAGLAPKQIADSMKGRLTIPQIRGIERTYGQSFKPPKKHPGGRPPKTRA